MFSWIKWKKKHTPTIAEAMRSAMLSHGRRTKEILLGQGAYNDLLNWMDWSERVSIPAGTGFKDQFIFDGAVVKLDENIGDNDIFVR